MGRKVKCANTGRPLVYYLVEGSSIPVSEIDVTAPELEHAYLWAREGERALGWRPMAELPGHPTWRRSDAPPQT